VDLHIPEIPSEDYLAEGEILEADTRLVAFGMATTIMLPRKALVKSGRVYWVVHQLDHRWCESMFYRKRVGEDFLRYGQYYRDLTKLAKEIKDGTR